MSALLQVTDAHIAYGKVEAVRGVSLEVGDNEIVTIIGANGAGKSTLLNAVMGVLPLKGRVAFAGEDMAQLEIEDRVALGVSLVPEHRELFSTMNVEDNLQLGAFRIPKATAAQSFERVYALFPRLQERRKQLAGTLSGGEQQMLAMGRALMGAPRLLMLDEPSLGLAPIIVADIFRTIGELRASGVSVLLVEQNAQAASKRATLDLQLIDALPAISADATQVRQVVMNLLTNASDALDERIGDITLRTGRMIADAEYLTGCLAADGVAPGEFVFIEVTDTGVGMSAETMSRIFEPFFTTKFTGRGLGLAATLGIVQGHGGALRVHSTVGSGTVFRVLFPSVQAREPTRRASPAVAEVHRSGTILVVDDEASVRDVAQRMLERSGYRVIVASDGDEGLRCFAEQEDAIIAIVLDVTMPRMSGTEVLAALRLRGKTVPIVLASGYSSESLATPASGDAAPVFVQKPFVTDALLAGIDIAVARNAPASR